MNVRLGEARPSACTNFYIAAPGRSDREPAGKVAVSVSAGSEMTTSSRRCEDWKECGELASRRSRAYASSRRIVLIKLHTQFAVNNAVYVCAISL